MCSACRTYRQPNQRRCAADGRQGPRHVNDRGRVEAERSVACICSNKQIVLRFEQNHWQSRANSSVFSLFSFLHPCFSASGPPCRFFALSNRTWRFAKRLRTYVQPRVSPPPPTADSLAPRASVRLLSRNLDSKRTPVSTQALPGSLSQSTTSANDSLR